MKKFETSKSANTSSTDETQPIADDAQPSVVDENQQSDMPKDIKKPDPKVNSGLNVTNPGGR